MGSYPRTMDTVTLNSQVYGLDPTFGELSYVKSPQPQFREEDRQVFWTSWTLRAFHNGERVPAILKQEDLDAGTYHDGEGLDVALLSDRGEVKLNPVLSQSLAVKSATMPMTVTSDGTTLLVGLTASPYVKIWTSAAGWVSATTLVNTSAVTDMITVGSTLYAVQGGVPITSTDAGDTWSALSGSHTGVVGIAYANGDVYLLKSGTGAGRVYNHTQAENVSTITGSVIAGYRENVYWGADSRLYLYNGRSVTLYDQMPAGFNLTALIPYRGVLLLLGYFKLRSGYRGAIYYIIQGTENHLYSLGDSTADHRIYAAAGSDDEIFFASPKRGGADRYDYTYGGISSGPAVGTAMYIPFKSMAVCEGYLWIGRYDNVGHAGTAQATGNDTTHTKLASGASASNDAYNGLTLWHTGGTGSGQTALISAYDGTTKIATHAAVATPADATTTYVVGTDGVYQADLVAPSTYRSTGWITSASYDFDYPNEKKLLRDIRVEHDALTTGQSVVVAYSLNEGSTWTTAVTSDTVSDTSKSASLSNIKANTLKLKLTLNAGATNTTTPTVHKLVARAAPVTEAKYLWQLRFLAHPKFDGATAMTALDTAYAAQAQLTFIDIDGSSHNVIIADAKTIRRPSENDDVGYMLVELREV